MISLNRRALTPKQQAELDNAVAAAVRNNDLIEYLAMMLDINIPIDEENENNE